MRVLFGPDADFLFQIGNVVGLCRGDGLLAGRRNAMRRTGMIFAFNVWESYGDKEGIRQRLCSINANILRLERTKTRGDCMVALFCSVAAPILGPNGCVKVQLEDHVIKGL